MKARPQRPNLKNKLNDTSSRGLNSAIIDNIFFSYFRSEPYEWEIQSQFIFGDLFQRFWIPSTIVSCPGTKFC